jgi:hypothetical protein
MPLSSKWLRLILGEKFLFSKEKEIGLQGDQSSKLIVVIECMKRSVCKIQ